MATKNRNNILEDVNFGGKQVRYPLSTGGSFDFNQGDFLWYDTSAHYVKALDSATDAGYLIGVAVKPSFIAPYTNFNVSGNIQKNYEPDALVIYGCIATMIMDTSDSAQTYYHGDSLYFATDAQHVTKQATSPANAVGKVWLPDSNMVSLAYSVGGLVPVLVVAQFPIASL